MIDKIAASISNHLLKKDIIASKDDYEICFYGLVCLLASGLQILILLLIAYIVNLLPQALCFLIAFSTLKQRIGGFHLGGQITCIGVSASLGIGMSWLAQAITQAWQPPVAIVSCFVTVFLVLIKGPVIHGNNPKTPEQHRQARSNALFWLGIESMLLILGLWLISPAWQSLPLSWAFAMLSAAFTLFLPIKIEGGCKS